MKFFFRNFFPLVVAVATKQYVTFEPHSLYGNKAMVTCTHPVPMDYVWKLGSAGKGTATCRHRHIPKEENTHYANKPLTKPKCTQTTNLNRPKYTRTTTIFNTPPRTCHGLRWRVYIHVRKQDSQCLDVGVGDQGYRTAEKIWQELNMENQSPERIGEF